MNTNPYSDSRPAFSIDRTIINTFFRGMGLVALLFMMTLHGAQPPTLMTLVLEWRYPEAAFRNASLSDGATVDLHGERTVPSSVYQCEFLTDDSVADVLAFYKGLLANPKGDPEIKTSSPREGRSLVVLDGGKDRKLEMKILLINENHSSTTLVVSRGRDESLTHIVWSHYLRSRA